MAIQRQLFTARLVQEEMLSEPMQTKHLVFTIEELENFDFAAGQFVSMVAPKEGKTMTRAYSIASAPRKNELDICLNRVPEGFFSNHLCDMKVGDTVKFHGPHGNFVLRNPLRDCVLIATGTGIAPMRGFVQWLFADEAHHQGKNVHLVYGTRYPTDVYYQEFFEEMAQKHPNFDYVVTLSRAGEDWKGQRGYVQEYVRKIVEARPEAQRNNMDAYICGLNDMVAANRKLLVDDLGWDKKQVIFERYD